MNTGGTVTKEIQKSTSEKQELHIQHEHIQDKHKTNTLKNI